MSNFFRESLTNLGKVSPILRLIMANIYRVSDIRDVRNSNFISIRFLVRFLKKAGNLFRMSFILFGLKKNSVRFGYCSNLLVM